MDALEQETPEQLANRLVGKTSPKLRRLVVAQCGRCHYCGHRFSHKAHRRPTQDHLNPQHNGGHHGATNLVAACYKCNQKKGPLDAETFIKVRDNPAALANAKRAAHGHPLKGLTPPKERKPDSPFAILSALLDASPQGER